MTGHDRACGGMWGHVGACGGMRGRTGRTGHHGAPRTGHVVRCNRHSLIVTIARNGRQSKPVTVINAIRRRCCVTTDMLSEPWLSIEAHRGVFAARTHRSRGKRRLRIYDVDHNSTATRGEHGLTTVTAYRHQSSCTSPQFILLSHSHGNPRPQSYSDSVFSPFTFILRDYALPGLQARGPSKSRLNFKEGVVICCTYYPGNRTNSMSIKVSSQVRHTQCLFLE